MTETLRTIGYYIAVIFAVSLPPAVLWWLIVHPLARFWRRLGPRVSLTVVAAICIALLVLLVLNVDVVLGRWLGFHWIFAVPGVALYGLAIWMERKTRRDLKLSVLVGAPEVGGRPIELLTQGMYSRVRNPRYLTVQVAVVGWAMILNYAGIWWMALGLLPSLYLITVLEERELDERYGEEYRRYKQRVPRFFPSLSPGAEE